MLGLPMALAVAACAHQVQGYDRDTRRSMQASWYPALERGRNDEALDVIAAGTDFGFAPLDKVVAHAEIVFITVQTCGHGSYDGTGPFPTGGAEYELARCDPARECCHLSKCGRPV